MSELQSFPDCVDALLEEFKLYDRTVDIVSCWEFFYTRIPSVSSNTLHFDRFPRMAVPKGSKRERKTPDFSVLISASYGLIGEIKHGFPLDDSSFLQQLNKLKKYDRPLRFRADDRARTITSTTHDILLIVPLRDAQEIAARTERLISQGKARFERKVVVFEWFYDSDREEYVFRRVANQTSDFNDSANADGVRLSKYFTESAKSLKVSPDKIKLIKAVWQFCNDDPKPIYTIVFLWTKILYHLLSQAQRDTWRRRNPQKELVIDLTVERVVKEISTRYSINWGHWTDWVTSALKTLEVAGLAKGMGGGRYAVGYRNLIREVGEPGRSADRRKGFHSAGYAKILATYVCRGKQRKSIEADRVSEGPTQGVLPLKPAAG